jgi:hypothetical protein
MGTLGRLEEIGDVPSGMSQEEGLGEQFSVEELEERFDIEERASRGGGVTERVERVAARLPQATWLLLAGGSILGAIVLKVMRRHAVANFVGEWAPTFLLIGLYNKLVRLERPSAMVY